MTTKQEMEPIRSLLTAATRTLLRRPDAEPEISINQGRDGIDIHVDCSPFDMSVLIGKNGSMKFALQNLIAHERGLDHWNVNLRFASSGTDTVSRCEGHPPEPRSIEELYEAMADMVPEAKVEPLEMSRTMVHGRMQMPEEMMRRIGYHLRRVFTTGAKSHGFPGTLYLEHPSEDP